MALDRIKFRVGIYPPLRGLEHVPPFHKVVRKYPGDYIVYDPDAYSEVTLQLAISYIYSRGNFRGRRGDLVREWRSPGWNERHCPTCGHVLSSAT